MCYLQNPFPSCREGKSLISCPVPNAFSCKRYFPQKNRIVKTSTDKEPPKLYLAAPQWQHRLPLDDRIALCRDHWQSYNNAEGQDIAPRLWSASCEETNRRQRAKEVWGHWGHDCFAQELEPQHQKCLQAALREETEIWTWALHPDLSVKECQWKLFHLQKCSGN